MNRHVKAICFIIVELLISVVAYSQNAIPAKTDSLIRTILSQEQLTTANDKGMTLIKESKFTEAGNYFSNEIKKDESDKYAYFNRGAVNWVMSDTLSACRDWSAVLALGDTATFKLLDKNCHGSMIIEDDTIPSVRYHKIFADNKTLSQQSDAVLVADEMPQFEGGDRGLVQYLNKNIKYPVLAREHGIAGTVYVNFIISKKGKIVFPYVQHKIGGGCDEEALRIVRSMPAWKPGKLKGKPVLVRHVLPVRFLIK